VYRDSEIFKSMRSKELMNKLVTQRMDNDTETDDEQVEKFVKRMSSDFLQHIKKVKSQAESIDEKNDKCE
jgi:Mn-dependent DtxR family transcriptional regulator